MLIGAPPLVVFYEASSFDDKSIKRWDVKSVTNAECSECPHTHLASGLERPHITVLCTRATSCTWAV